MEINVEKHSRLLIDCLKKPETIPNSDLASRLKALSGEEWQHVLELSKNQRVMPILLKRLRQKGLVKVLPDGVTQTLRNRMYETSLYNLRFYGELNKLLAVLNSHGIPLILLKGIYLAKAVYGDIGLREMNDIDVLARPEDLDRIVSIMTKMGYRSLQDQPIHSGITIRTHHHLPRMVKENTGVEIHWNLTSPNQSYSIEPEGLWERALPIRTFSVEARTLSPEDLLLHLCMHVSYKHFFVFGLRPFVDIAETISHNMHALDWEIVKTRAIQNNWQKGVFLSLKLASDWLDAKVPADVLDAICPAEQSDTLCDVARALVFSDKRIDHALPRPIADLLQSRGFKDKARILRDRVFLPKHHIASIYSVPVDSFRIYLYYLRRLMDLLRRHNQIVKKYNQNDPAVKALVERKYLLAGWLAPSHDAS